MAKKKDLDLLERKKRKLDPGIIEPKLDIRSKYQHTLLTTEQRFLKSLYEGDMKPAQKILCVERHQRTDVGYLRTDTPACKWGQTREDATTCGDCPFGIKLLEFVPKNDAKTVLKQLEREQDDKDKIYF